MRIQPALMRMFVLVLLVVTVTLAGFFFLLLGFLGSIFAVHLEAHRQTQLGLSDLRHFFGRGIVTVWCSERSEGSTRSTSRRAPATRRAMLHNGKIDMATRGLSPDAAVPDPPQLQPGNNVEPTSAANKPRSARRECIEICFCAKRFLGISKATRSALKPRVSTRRTSNRSRVCSCCVQSRIYAFEQCRTRFTRRLSALASVHRLSHVARSKGVVRRRIQASRRCSWHQRRTPCVAQ